MMDLAANEAVKTIGDYGAEKDFQATGSYGPEADAERRGFDIPKASEVLESDTEVPAETAVPEADMKSEAAEEKASSPFDFSSFVDDFSVVLSEDDDKKKKKSPWDFSRFIDRPVKEKAEKTIEEAEAPAPFEMEKMEVKTPKMEEITEITDKNSALTETMKKAADEKTSELFDSLENSYNKAKEGWRGTADNGMTPETESKSEKAAADTFLPGLQGRGSTRIPDTGKNESVGKQSSDILESIKAPENKEASDITSPLDAYKKLSDTVTGKAEEPENLGVPEVDNSFIRAVQAATDYNNASEADKEAAFAELQKAYNDYKNTVDANKDKLTDSQNSNIEVMDSLFDTINRGVEAEKETKEIAKRSAEIDNTYDAFMTAVENYNKKEHTADTWAEVEAAKKAYDETYEKNKDSAGRAQTGKNDILNKLYNDLIEIQKRNYNGEPEPFDRAEADEWLAARDRWDAGDRSKETYNTLKKGIKLNLSEEQLEEANKMAMEAITAKYGNNTSDDEKKLLSGLEDVLQRITDNIISSDLLLYALVHMSDSEIKDLGFTDAAITILRNWLAKNGFVSEENVDTDAYSTETTHGETPIEEAEIYNPNIVQGVGGMNTKAQGHAEDFNEGIETPESKALHTTVYNQPYIRKFASNL